MWFLTDEKCLARGQQDAGVRLPSSQCINLAHEVVDAVDLNFIIPIEDVEAVDWRAVDTSCL